MAFPPSFIDELIARNPIEDVVGQHVSLKRSGGNLFGMCPFHGEKTASFSVAPDKGIYYCFGCHKGGGVINFQMEIEGLSYPDAVRALAKRAGMQVPEDEQYQSRYRQQERLWALHKEAARFFHSQLYAPVGVAALEYARGRGMTKSILTTFGVGYAPNSWDSMVKAMRVKGYTDQELIDSGLVTVSKKNGNLFDRFRDRLMFPIIDVRGNVIGFGGRIINNSDPNAAKYLNSPETIIFNKRKNLFGLNLAKKTKENSIILVEGNIDVVALHQYGFDNAVASLGTSLTEEHAALLTRYTDQVILIYDGDEAGQRATRRAIPILEKAGLQVKVLKIRDAKDPDEYLKKFGADKFKLLLEDASNRVEYQLNAILRKYDIREDDQRVKFIQECAQLISTLPSSVQREVYGHRVAETGGISHAVIQLAIQIIGTAGAQKMLFFACNTVVFGVGNAIKGLGVTVAALTQRCAVGFYGEIEPAVCIVIYAMFFQKIDAAFGKAQPVLPNAIDVAQVGVGPAAAALHPDAFVCGINLTCPVQAGVDTAVFGIKAVFQPEIRYAGQLITYPLACIDKFFTVHEYHLLTKIGRFQSAV